MTISEMHTAVKQKLDKTSSLELPSFENEEIDFWLNDAIDTFIKQRMEGINLKKTGFEHTQKRIDDLKTLVVSGHPLSLNSNSYYDNDTCFYLPYDYFRYLGDQVIINTGTSTNKVGTTTVTIDTLTVKLKDPFSEHNLHHQAAEPLRLLRGDVATVSGILTEYGEIIYISDGNYTIDSCYLSYIKKPVIVSISSGTTSNLPEVVHIEIVNIAVKKMLENIESQRYGSFTNETITIE